MPRLRLRHSGDGEAMGGRDHPRVCQNGFRDFLITDESSPLLFSFCYLYVAFHHATRPSWKVGVRGASRVMG